MIAMAMILLTAAATAIGAWLFDGGRVPRRWR